MNKSSSSSSSSVGIIRIHHHHGLHHGSGSAPSSSSGSGSGGSIGGGGGSSTTSPTRADLFCRAECSALRPLHDAGSTTAVGGGSGVGGVIQANGALTAGGGRSSGSVLYAFRLEGGGGGGGGGGEGTGRRGGGGEESLFKGKELSFGGGGGGEILLHDMEKTGAHGHGQEDHRLDRGVLKRASPTHCLSKTTTTTTTNGATTTHCPTTTTTDAFSSTAMHLDFRKKPSGKQRTTYAEPPLANGFHHHHLVHQGASVSPPPPPACPTAPRQEEEERQPSHPSCHIPVPPRHRKPSGHADKEVMAATVLTSLSTSPLVLHPASTVPDPATRGGWKETLSASYSSSTSGNWSWDACSDQSVPSTPSPPLSHDHALLAKEDGFLLSPSHGDDVSELDGVTDGTHFLFEDPIPRKRKNSMKVMFKCLWKNCEKVLSTSSGIQRHVRTVHLGRSSDSDLSDGEEDFYYSEIEVNVDSLTEGLSSLTPTSPTTAGPPPFFPHSGGGSGGCGGHHAVAPFFPSVPRSEHISVIGQPQAPPLLLLQQDHHPAPTLLSQSAPSTLCHIRTDHAYQGPVSHVRTVSIGEKRQPASNSTPPHPPSTKNHTLTSTVPKPAPGTRKPRGEAKKCRKVYGMEKRDMWCTACRWKKACQRFTD